MEALIKLNTQAAGRDKIARLIQYLSRLVWHSLKIRRRAGVETLKNLEYQLSTFRKLLRFGKCFDVIYSTLPLLKYNDPTVKFTVVLSKISNSLFLLADHFLWLGRADVVKVDTDKWSRLCNKYWLTSISMSLARDVYEILKIYRIEQNKIFTQKQFKGAVPISLLVTCLIQAHKEVVIDTVKNTCDLFIPLNSLGYVNLSPGTIGFLGVISSIAGLLTLIDPLSKLSPA